MNEELSVFDWWCCVSIALDKEDADQYNLNFAAYIAGGYDPKKFPGPSKPYTVAPSDRKVDVVKALRDGGFPVGAARGSLEEYARIKGLRKVYKLEDGTFVDEDGNPTQQPPGTVYVTSKGA